MAAVSNALDAATHDGVLLAQRWRAASRMSWRRSSALTVAHRRLARARAAGFLRGEGFFPMGRTPPCRENNASASILSMLIAGRGEHVGPNFQSAVSVLEPAELAPVA